MAIITIEYEKGDEVLLPFDEEGTITDIEEYPWVTKYWVGITKSNGFNNVGEIVDYFKKDLELKKK